MPNGVYFGWAKLQGEDAQAHKMVMNVGNRPTFVDGDGVSGVFVLYFRICKMPYCCLSVIPDVLSPLRTIYPSDASYVCIFQTYSLDKHQRLEF